MGKFRDRTGDRVGRLTVIERAEDYIDKSGARRTMWRCVCDCGNEVIVRADSLSEDHTRSCGCFQRDKVSTVMKFMGGQNKTHGDSKTRLHNIWYLMRYRCNVPNCKAYKNYGGRGIKVCPEWDDGVQGYLNFKKWALDNGYNDNLSIDRIDNDRNYEPCNCRWVDDETQCNNKRTNVFLECDGEVHTISQWARITGIPMKALHSRIKYGWAVDDALHRPIKKSYNTIDG